MNMTPADESSLRDKEIIKKGLWNPEIDPNLYRLELYHGQVLEQYKMCVGLAEQISSRRASANAFFVSIHTLMLSAITLVYVNNEQLVHRWLIIFPLIAFLFLCYVWKRMLKSFRQLNAAKFLVIEEYERCLPTRPMVEAEWKALGEGKDPKKYTEMTGLEGRIPVVFALLYLFGAAAVTFF